MLLRGKTKDPPTRNASAVPRNHVLPCPQQPFFQRHHDMGFVLVMDTKFTHRIAKREDHVCCGRFESIY